MTIHRFVIKMNLNVLAPKAKNCLKEVPSLTPSFFIPVAKASGLLTTERNVYTNSEWFSKTWIDKRADVLHGC